MALAALDELLLAAGGEVEQPPGGAGVKLGLVPAQRPHVGDPHHLVLAALHHLPRPVLHAHHLLTVEGQHQHRALLHHLPRVQVDAVDVWKHKC